MNDSLLIDHSLRPNEIYRIDKPLYFSFDDYKSQAPRYPENYGANIEVVAYLSRVWKLFKNAKI